MSCLLLETGDNYLVPVWKSGLIPDAMETRLTARPA